MQANNIDNRIEEEIIEPEKLSLGSKVEFYNRLSASHEAEQHCLSYLAVRESASSMTNLLESRPLHIHNLMTQAQIVKETIGMCKVIHLHGKDVEGSDPPQRMIKFGALFSISSDHTDKLAGLLRFARKIELINFEGEVLLQNVHDDVAIILLKPIKDVVDELKRRHQVLKEILDDRKDSQNIKSPSEQEDFSEEDIPLEDFLWQQKQELTFDDAKEDEINENIYFSPKSSLTQLTSTKSRLKGIFSSTKVAKNRKTGGTAGNSDTALSAQEVETKRSTSSTTSSSSGIRGALCSIGKQIKSIFNETVHGIQAITGNIALSEKPSRKLKHSQENIAYFRAAVSTDDFERAVADDLSTSRSGTEYMQIFKHTARVTGVHPSVIKGYGGSDVKIKVTHDQNAGDGSVKQEATMLTKTGEEQKWECIDIFPPKAERSLAASSAFSIQACFSPELIPETLDTENESLNTQISDFSLDELRQNVSVKTLINDIESKINASNYQVSDVDLDETVLAVSKSAPVSALEREASKVSSALADSTTYTVIEPKVEEQEVKEQEEKEKEVKEQKEKKQEVKNTNQVSDVDLIKTVLEENKSAPASSSDEEVSEGSNALADSTADTMIEQKIEEQEVKEHVEKEKEREKITNKVSDVDLNKKVLEHTKSAPASFSDEETSEGSNTLAELRQNVSVKTLIANIESKTSANNNQVSDVDLHETVLAVTKSAPISASDKEASKVSSALADSTANTVIEQTMEEEKVKKQEEKEKEEEVREQEMEEKKTCQVSDADLNMTLLEAIKSAPASASDKRAAEGSIVLADPTADTVIEQNVEEQVVKEQEVKEKKQEVLEPEVKEQNGKKQEMKEQEIEEKVKEQKMKEVVKEQEIKDAELKEQEMKEKEVEVQVQEKQATELNELPTTSH